MSPSRRRDASPHRPGLWKLPDLWTHRTRPHGPCKPQNGLHSYHRPSSLLALFSQERKAGPTLQSLFRPQILRRRQIFVLLVRAQIGKRQHGERLGAGRLMERVEWQLPVSRDRKLPPRVLVHLGTVQLVWRAIRLRRVQMPGHLPVRAVRTRPADTTRSGRSEPRSTCSPPRGTRFLQAHLGACRNRVGAGVPATRNPPRRPCDSHAPDPIRMDAPAGPLMPVAVGAGSGRPVEGTAWNEE